jgi:peroxiredoxin
LLGARILLAAVFVTAGVAKLRDRQGTGRALAGFGVPGRAIPAGVILLPLVEMATAAALVPKPSAQWGGLAALILLLAFTGGIANAMLRGRAPDCNCFGQLHSEPVGWRTLLRNVALAAPAALITVEGSGPSLPAWVSDRSAAELAAIGGFIAAALLGALAMRFRRQRDGFRQGLENARADLARIPLGLPIGVAAPDFTLPSINGEKVSLDELRARGRPVALLFVSPGCGPCEQVFSNVGRWQRPLAEDITLALVSSGTPEENQAAVGNGDTNVLLQEDYEVNQAYRIRSTPVAVVVSPEGRIASPAVGGTAIESLIRITLREGAERLSPSRLATARASA